MGNGEWGMGERELMLPHPPTPDTPPILLHPPTPPTLPHPPDPPCPMPHALFPIPYSPFPNSASSRRITDASLASGTFIK